MIGIYIRRSAIASLIGTREDVGASIRRNSNRPNATRRKRLDIQKMPAIRASNPSR